MNSKRSIPNIEVYAELGICPVIVSLEWKRINVWSEKEIEIFNVLYMFIEINALLFTNGVVGMNES